MRELRRRPIFGNQRAVAVVRLCDMRRRHLLRRSVDVMLVLRAGVLFRERLRQLHELRWRHGSVVVDNVNMLAVRARQGSGSGIERVRELRRRQTRDLAVAGVQLVRGGDVLGSRGGVVYGVRFWHGARELRVVELRVVCGRKGRVAWIVGVLDMRRWSVCGPRVIELLLLRPGHDVNLRGRQLCELRRGHVRIGDRLDGVLGVSGGHKAGELRVVGMLGMRRWLVLVVDGFIVRLHELCSGQVPIQPWLDELLELRRGDGVLVGRH